MKRPRDLPYAVTVSWRAWLLGVVGIWLSSAVPAFSAVSLELASLSPVVLNPGQSFSFEVFLRIEGNEQVTGFDYYLQASGASYGGDFSVLTRTSATEVFSDLNTPDTTLSEVLLDPSESFSLGASVANPFEPVAIPGTYLVATYTLGSGIETPPGFYQIFAVNAVWFDGSFTDRSFSNDPILTVQVIPEVSAAALVALFALFVVAVRIGRRIPAMRFARFPPGPP